MENQLFNRRVTKFIKVSMQSHIQNLPHRMQITQTLSIDLRKSIPNYSELFPKIKLYYYTAKKSII